MNLRHLTLKTVMLLALTRPSRSADLAKQDIQWMSYQAGGVTSQPADLAKQSSYRSSKHLADFFFPLLLLLLLLSILSKDTGSTKGKPV